MRPSEKRLQELRAPYLEQGVKEAAHTLLNRLVIVRILEQAGLLTPALVSGGFRDLPRSRRPSGSTASSFRCPMSCLPNVTLHLN